jgi:hypothetical protein
MTKDDSVTKGIHDPWRLGTDAWRPPAGDAPAGAQGSAEEMDWDLTPRQWYVLRVGGTSIKVMGVDDPVKAVMRLLHCYKKDDKLREVFQSAGFTDQLTPEAATGFMFKVGEEALCCPDATSTEEGLRRLNKALRAAIRQDPTMKQRLDHLGIIPLVE